MKLRLFFITKSAVSMYHELMNFLQNMIPDGKRLCDFLMTRGVSARLFGELCSFPWSQTYNINIALPDILGVYV